MPINAVFLQQLLQLRPTHFLQLNANRSTLHTKARDRWQYAFKTIQTLSFNSQN